MRRPRHALGSLAADLALACVVACLAVGCNTGGDIAPIAYTCGTSDPSVAVAGDPVNDCSDLDAMYLPLEPMLPPTPADPTCILKATHQTTDSNWMPDETNLDTGRHQHGARPLPGRQAGDRRCEQRLRLGAARGSRRRRSGSTPASRSTPRAIRTSTRPNRRGTPTDCGETGVNDSAACKNFITVNAGANPAIVGDGIIDGQGGEPLIGHDYSWWQLSSALAMIDGSIGNPTLINLSSGVTGFLMYRITLHNSPKFHVKITSTPAGGIDGPLHAPAPASSSGG